MGAAENSALVRYLYTEVSNGNPQPLVDHLDDDVEWTIIGSTPLSGVFQGKAEVVTKLFGGLRAVLEAPVQFTFERFVAEGDRVVMEARGHGVTHDGRPYDNRYCIILEVVDGRLRRIIDYVDTDLVNRVLYAQPA